MIASLTPFSAPSNDAFISSVWICILLVRYLWKRLSEVEGLELYGPPVNEAGDNRNPLVAFNSRDVHANDLSFFLDQARGGERVPRSSF